MMQSAYRINVSRPGMADLQDDLNQSISPQNVNDIVGRRERTASELLIGAKKYREARGVIG